MFVECSLTPSVVKDGFAVLNRDGRQHFYFFCPGGISGKVRCVCVSSRGGEEGVEVSFLSFIKVMVKWERSYMTP